MIEHLEYSLADVHDEADRLEHHISDDLGASVAATIDDPETDTHGNPIPNSTLEFPDQPIGTALSECEEDSLIERKQVSDRDPEVLEYFSDREINPGTKLVIREVAPFGLYTLESTGGGAAVALPDEVA